MHVFGEEAMSEHIFFLCSSITLSCSIISVNTLIIYFMVKNSKMLKSVSNKILLSLVIGDFCSGLSIILHIVATLVDRLSMPSKASEYSYRIIVDIITLWLHLVSVGNLCFIVFERYVAVCHTYTMHRYINKKTIKFILAFIWLTSLFYPCIQLIWLKVLMVKDTITENEGIQITKNDTIFSVVSIVLFVILPVILLLIGLYRMFRVIRKFPNEEKRRKRKNEQKALKLFTAMYATFVIFCLPYFTVRLVIDLRPEEISNIPKFAMESMFIMKYLPPLLNPFIYVFNKPEFRRILQACKTKSKLDKIRQKISLSRTSSKTRCDTEHKLLQENSGLSSDTNNNPDKNMIEMV